MQRVSIAYAPASIANVAVGFDILGFSVPILYDRVIATRSKYGVQISDITGIVDNLPNDPMKNTAGFALVKMIENEDIPHGISIKIDKGIPLGSGLGGSAASAVAAVVAANNLLDNPLSKSNLFKYAMYGESIASGSFHGDNVGASLYGGLIACIQQDNTGIEINDFKILKLPTPKFVYCVLIHPHLQLETKMARDIINPVVSLKSYVKQSMFLTSFLVGCYNQDSDIIRSSLNDIIIEPQRIKLIPNFDKLKNIALENNALGFSISGAGPSMFSWCETKRDALKIKEGIIGLMDEFTIELDIWVTQIDIRGAFLK